MRCEHCPNDVTTPDARLCDDCAADHGDEWAALGQPLPCCTVCDEEAHLDERSHCTECADELASLQPPPGLAHTYRYYLPKASTR